MNNFPQQTPQPIPNDEEKNQLDNVSTPPYANLNKPGAKKSEDAPLSGKVMSQSEEKQPSLFPKDDGYSVVSNEQSNFASMPEIVSKEVLQAKKEKVRQQGIYIPSWEERLPEGEHTACIVDVNLEKGVNGKYGPHDRLVLTFAVKKDEANIHYLYARYPVSWNASSRYVRVVSHLLNRNNWQNAKLEEFIGIYCLVTVAHKQVDQRIYENITGLVRLEGPVEERNDSND